jgi:uncharacterized metal-binding protein YceD (DUF177 family)
MNKDFQIFIDRLKDGQTLTIEEKCSPMFLDIHEEGLKFTSPVDIKGRAYLTSDHLILHLSIATEGSMPCLICNDFFSFPISIDEFTHAEPLADIVNHIFDFTELLRETILLEVPAFAECNQGKCPERVTLANYLKLPQNTKSSEPVHYPFNNL